MRAALLTAAAAAAAADGVLLLRDAAMLMAHDAATGYMDGGDVVTGWTKTQEGSWAEMAACGARAFDVRPKLDGSKLVMHHGSITVNTLLADAFGDLVNASAAAPGEVFVPVIVDCDGGGCADAAKKVLDGKGVKYVTDCSELKTLTYADAVARGALPNNGSVLAVFGCSDQNYDSGIGCYPPYEKGTAAVNTAAAAATAASCGCYDGGSKQQAAFAVMDRYLNKTQAKATSQLAQTQLLWQEGVNTVTDGTLCGSSLVKDTQRSKLNAHALPLLQAWQHLNFLEVNDVCGPDGTGKKLLSALQARNHARGE